MQRIRKVEYQAPNISLFLPSLAADLEEGYANQAIERDRRWQPRWTILFSLAMGSALWAGIFWLIGL
jgi:hypothetical protein